MPQQKLPQNILDQKNNKTYGMDRISPTTPAAFNPSPLILHLASYKSKRSQMNEKESVESETRVGVGVGVSFCTPSVPNAQARVMPAF